jgi:hypothetical protein
MVFHLSQTFYRAADNIIPSAFIPVNDLSTAILGGGSDFAEQARIKKVTKCKVTSMCLK